MDFHCVRHGTLQLPHSFRGNVDESQKFGAWRSMSIRGWSCGCKSVLRFGKANLRLGWPFPLGCGIVGRWYKAEHGSKWDGAILYYDVRNLDGAERPPAVRGRLCPIGS